MSIWFTVLEIHVLFDVQLTSLYAQIKKIENVVCLGACSIPLIMEYLFKWLSGFLFRAHVRYSNR